MARAGENGGLFRAGLRVRPGARVRLGARGARRVAVSALVVAVLLCGAGAAPQGAWADEVADAAVAESVSGAIGESQGAASADANGAAGDAGTAENGGDAGAAVPADAAETAAPAEAAEPAGAIETAETVELAEAAAPTAPTAPTAPKKAPVSVAVEMSAQGPVVTWEPVAGVTKYEVYRKRAGGTWKKLATLKAQKGFQGAYTYVDADKLFAGAKYSYRLRVSMSAAQAHPAAGQDVDGAGAAGAGDASLPEGGSSPGGTEGSTSAGSAPAPSATPAVVRSYSAAASCKTPAFEKTAPRATRSAAGKRMTIRWKPSQYADGYTVEYATSRVFSSPEVIEVERAGAHKHVVESLSKGKTYYVRVCARQEQDDATVRSAWGYSSNARVASTVKVKRVKAKRTRAKKVRVKVKRTKAQYRKALARARAKARAAHKRLKRPSRYYYKTVKRRYKALVPYEVASAAGQRLGRYDTVQGGCSDGAYAYFVLNNRIKNDCRVAKVRLRDMRTVKVSRTLAIGHGNDIACDSKRGRLVIAQGNGAGLVLPVLSSKTLKLKKLEKIKFPDKLPGATAGQARQLTSATGVSGIAYDSAHSQFVAVVSGYRRVLFLDSQLVPKRYALLSEKCSGVQQAVEVVGDMLAICESPGVGLGVNRLHLFDLGGTAVRTVRLRVGNELENVFSVGNKLYASIYASRYSKTSYDRNNYVYRLRVTAKRL